MSPILLPPPSTHTELGKLACSTGPAESQTLACCQVADWARQHFLEECSKPDDELNLAKACMLIALEDEAAAVADAAAAAGRPLPPALVARTAGAANHRYRGPCGHRVLSDPSLDSHVSPRWHFFAGDIMVPCL